MFLEIWRWPGGSPALLSPQPETPQHKLLSSHPRGPGRPVPEQPSPLLSLLPPPPPRLGNNGKGEVTTQAPATAPRKARFPGASWAGRRPTGREPAQRPSRLPHLLWGGQASLVSPGRALAPASTTQALGQPPAPVCPSGPQQSAQELRPPRGPEVTTAGPAVEVS